MKRIEEIIGDKILDMINYVLSKIIKPDIEIADVTQLDEESIKRLTEEYGIEGIILDVDETLRRDMNKIPKCNEEWIETIRGHLKVIVLSNGIDKGIESFFQERGIDYIGFAFKPLKKNFKVACKKMGLEPDKVLMVGDSLCDDIYGGKRNKMKTALVKGVKEDDGRDE